MRTIVACVLMTLAISACDDSPTGPKAGYVRVSVVTTGGDLDDAFEVVSGNIARPVSANGLIVLDLPSGEHSLELTGIADNCVLNGNKTRLVDVRNNDTTDVVFFVGCAATGIRLVAWISGDDAPATLNLVVSESSFAVAANNEIAISRLAPGRYQLAISAGIPSCSVSGDSVVAADVVNRQMTDVVFNIECHPVPRTGAIAFVEGNSLMLMNTDGSGIGRLNRGWHPSWSGDGARLVYSTTDCDEYYSCTGSLEIVDPATRQITALPNVGFAWNPAWSPVDDVIAFFSPDSGSVFLYDIATATKAKLVTENQVGIYVASWSPDGSQLAGACQEPGHLTHICVFNRDGTGLRFLTSDASIADHYPSWSPDGSRIAFNRYSGGVGRLAVINADGTGLRDLTVGMLPTWSPDSRQIIFSGTRGLYTINIDGTGLNQLTDGFHYSPVWRR